MRVWCGRPKGLEPDILYRTWRVEALGDQIPLAYVWPNVCERTGGRFTDTLVGLYQPDLPDDLQQLLHCGKSFRVYSNQGFHRCVFGGAVKNVIAIGAGMSDYRFWCECAYGADHRGLATEMSRLGAALSDILHLYGHGGAWRSGAYLYRQPVA
ncbi:hypothetical protein ACLK10_20120 [Escherichia coli]